MNWIMRVKTIPEEVGSHFMKCCLIEGINNNYTCTRVKNKSLSMQSGIGLCNRENLANHKSH